MAVVLFLKKKKKNPNKSVELHRGAAVGKMDLHGIVGYTREAPRSQMSEEEAAAAP